MKWMVVPRRLKLKKKLGTFSVNIMTSFTNTSQMQNTRIFLAIMCLFLYCKTKNI